MTRRECRLLSQGNPPDMRKPKVLIVDDTRANALALEAVLADDYETLSVSSGEAALALLRERQDIDVVLMDVQMPGMDGFEAAREVKKIAGCADIPIVFVTAVYSEDPFVKKGYQVGGIDYFAKPFDPDILRLKVAIYATFRQRSEFLRDRERHLRQSEELLRVGRKLSSVLESLPVGVLIADVEGRVCQATDEVWRILRCSEPLERGQYGAILGWWDESGSVLKSGDSALSRAIRAGESSHSERIALRCADGTTTTVLASASPLRGLDRGIVGAVVLLQDVSETAKIEEALEERVARLVGTGVELEETLGR